MTKASSVCWWRVASAAFAFGAALIAGSAQADQASASSDPTLQVYELPDKSASILLPSDWRVVQTGVAYARARGPNGELALFGAVVPAHNSAGGATQAVLNQPYSTDDKDQFVQSANFLLLHVGMSAVPFNILSATRIKAPDAFGTCTNFTMLAGPKSGVAAEADFCSLPMDKNGDYQNFFKLVAVQAKFAKQERSMLEKMLASYALEANVVRRSKAIKAMGAPMSRPVGMAGVPNSAMSMALINAQARAIQSSTLYGQMSSLKSASDFDHGILRDDIPVYAEGESSPMFWIGNDD